jgi:aminoglycoside phosphotransferase (APT) family kinase protein
MQEVVDHYAERTGRDLSGALFYYVYGLFKTAVFLQQIYYRYRHGQTDDPRFAHFGEGTRVLVDHAAGVIERDRL